MNQLKKDNNDLEGEADSLFDNLTKKSAELARWKKWVPILKAQVKSVKQTIDDKKDEI